MALEEQKYSLFLEVIFHFVNEGTGKSQLAGMVRKCTYKEKRRGQLRRELCGHLILLGFLVPAQSELPFHPHILKHHCISKINF